MTTTDTPRIRRMIVATVPAVVRIYLIAAMTFSWTNVMAAYHSLGMTGWHLYLSPMSIDFWVLLGMLLRLEAWSTRTRRIGLRMQFTAGSLSLSANVYAGASLGDRVFDGLMVLGYMGAELLCTAIQTLAAELAEQDAAQAATVQAAQLAAVDADRAERNRKERERRAARKLADQLAQQKDAERKAQAAERRRLARQVKELEGSFAAESAPVSDMGYL